MILPHHVMYCTLMCYGHHYFYSQETDELVHSYPTNDHHICYYEDSGKNGTGASLVQVKVLMVYRVDMPRSRTIFSPNQDGLDFERGVRPYDGRTSIKK